MDAAAQTPLGVTLMTLLVGFAVLTVLAFALMGPRETWDLEAGMGLLSRLRKRRARLLRAIKDLEVGKESGALAQAEFQDLRDDFKRRAVRVTKDLERVRKLRVFNLMRKRRPLTPSQKKHVEELVQIRAARRQTGPQETGETN